MDRIKEIKEDIAKMQDILYAVISRADKSDIDKLAFHLSDILDNVIELEKIQNYTTASANTPTVTEKKDNSSMEMVNHPSHYQGSKYECIDVMVDVFGKEKVSAFCELNAFKYQWRANNKGTNIQDKKKAIWYNQKYIDLNKE